MNEFDELGDFIEPVTASECFNKSLEFLERGKFEDALFYVEAAIEKNYFGTDVYLVRAQILLELERTEEADEDITIALAQEPFNSELLIWKARIQAALGNTDESLKILTELTEQDPSNSEALISIAMIHYMSSDYSRAEEVLLQIYDNYVIMPEQKAVAAYWLAKIKQIENKNDEAAEYYASSMDMSPFFSYVYSDYADLLRSSSRLEESEEVFLRGLDLFPENAGLANDYANLLRQMNRDDESIEYLQEAIKHDPKLVQAFYNLGLTYMKKERFADAAECFEKVIEESPEDSEAKVRLAESYAELKNWGRAYELTLQSCEEDTSNSEFLVVFSDIANAYLVELEDSASWDKAIEVLISMFNISVDAFKPEFNKLKNSEAVDRLLKVFRYLEVYQPKAESDSKLMRSNINLIRFNHALKINEFIIENDGLKSYQIDMLDEFQQYLDANIGVIREISKKLDNESDPLAYYGFYLQAMYYWRLKNESAEAEANLYRAINHCTYNMAALLNVKAHYFKSRFNFNESILTYLNVVNHDRNAIWAYREISKLYAGMRNIEAAIYYHQKYMRSMNDYAVSARESARAQLDSAALWLAYGNYTRCKQDIEKCKKNESKLDKKNRFRLKLIEIFVAIETRKSPRSIHLLFKKISKQSDNIEALVNINLQYSALVSRFYEQNPEFSDEVPEYLIDYANQNLLQFLPELELHLHADNKRKFNSVFNKTNARLKIQDYNEIHDYFDNLSDKSANSKIIDFIIKLLAPISKVSEDAWENTHDLVYYPEEYAYFRRIAHIKLLEMIQNATSPKMLDKVFNCLVVLTEIAPSDHFAKLLLIHVSWLNHNSYDYLNLSKYFEYEKKLLRIRDLFMLTKLGDAEDLLFLEELDSANSNYNLARIRAMQSYSEDALIHLENFVDDSNSKAHAKSYAKSDYAFDVLRSENSGFYRLIEEDIDYGDDEEDSDDFDIDYEGNTDDTDIVMDLLNELNKDLETIGIDINFTNEGDKIDKASKKPENVNNFDKPSEIHKKSQTKKVDSPNDNSSDSDEIS